MLIRRVPSLAPSGAFFRWALRTCALLLILGTGTLLAFLLFKGLPTLGARLFFGDVPALDALLGRQAVWDGLWPACAGTACLVGLTVLLAVFPGVGCGLYLAEFAPKRQAARIRLAMDVLAGTPSIVMGLFGFTLILFLRKTFQTEANTSLFLAAACQREHSCSSFLMRERLLPSEIKREDWTASTSSFSSASSKGREAR